MFPLAYGFGFKDVPISRIPVSEVQTTLMLFPIEPVSAKVMSRVLAAVETEVEKFLGNFVLREYDAVMAAKLPNGARLNHVLEQMGVAYGPRPLPGNLASQAARDKRKAKVSKNWP
jgi:hypothetical protein